MDSFTSYLMVAAPPVLLAITLHEAAHGYVAKMCGDSTAAEQGRVTLNPLRHIDLIGTIIIPIIVLLSSTGFLFGWAKPVPVDPRRLRNPRQDMFWVALAGPGSNFLMALAWAALYKLFAAGELSGVMLGWLIPMTQLGISINLVLMALNLFPLLPLDGGRMLAAVLPINFLRQYSRLEKWGMLILLLLLLAGLLSWWLNPLISAGWLVIAKLIGINLR